MRLIWKKSSLEKVKWSMIISVGHHADIIWKFVLYRIWESLYDLTLTSFKWTKIKWQELMNKTYSNLSQLWIGLFKYFSDLIVR